MEVLTHPKQVKDYLHGKRWMTDPAECTVTELAGGVSCQVWKIESPDGRWVLKQALPRLKVKSEWFADVNRIEREQTAMKAAHAILPRGRVPEILRRDPASFLFLMSCAPEHSETWKQQLMDGRYNERTALQIGAMLRTLHKKSREIPGEAAAELKDLTFFHELRLDPFHRYLANLYPELRKPINSLMEELTSSGECLVHGDFSPKNILSAPDGEIVLLDYEAAHWGKPVYDLSFCLGHLLLKGFSFDRRESAFRLIASLLQAYGPPPANLTAHLGLMLLARIDGKSPVHYIPDRATESAVRNLAVTWLKESAAQGTDTLDAIKKALLGGRT